MKKNTQIFLAAVGVVNFFLSVHSAADHARFFNSILAGAPHQTASAPPDSLAGFKRPSSMGRDGKEGKVGKRRERMGEEVKPCYKVKGKGDGKGGEREGESGRERG